MVVVVAEAQKIPPELLAAMQKDDAEFGNDDSANGTASRARTTRPKTAPKSRSRQRQETSLEILEEKLTEHFIGLSMMVSMVDEFDGAVLANGSPRLASAYTKLAAENPKVKKALEGMMEASAWGEVIIATTMVVVPIAKHHGITIRLPKRANLADSNGADPVG